METEQKVIGKGRGLDAFTLKIIAIIGMTMDHTGLVFRDFLPLWAKCILIAFGGLTFPIMAYLIGEGYRHTKNIKKYMLRLLIFALIAQVPYYMFLMKQLNILFTLLLGLLAIYIIERSKSRAISVLVVIGFIIVSVSCDWGLMGVPMILIYYYKKNRLARVTLPLILPFAFFALNIVMQFAQGWPFLEILPDLLFIVVGCSLTIPLLISYNGQRGKPMRYFFYIYYPLHIIVLGLIRLFPVLWLVAIIAEG